MFVLLIIHCSSVKNKTLERFLKNKIVNYITNKILHVMEVMIEILLNQVLVTLVTNTCQRAASHINLRLCLGLTA